MALYSVDVFFSGRACVQVTADSLDEADALATSDVIDTIGMIDIVEIIQVDNTGDITRIDEEGGN